MADDTLKNKFYERCLALLRTLTGTATGSEGERQAAASLFVKHWTKGWQESGRETKHAATVDDFIAYASRHESFRDNLGQTNIQGIYDLLSQSAHVVQEHLPEDETAKAFVKNCTDFFLQQENAANQAARRIILLDIAKQRKEASLLRKAGGGTLARNLEQEVERSIATNKFTQQDVDAFILEREKIMLDLFGKLDVWGRTSDPNRKNALENEIHELALVWGFLQQGTSEPEYTDEFQDTYKRYLLDRDAYEKELKELESKFNAKGAAPASAAPAAAQQSGAQPSSTAHSSPPPPPPPPPSPPPPVAVPVKEVKLYPLRDADGKVMAYIGATSYFEALEKFGLAKKNIFSLTQDFPLDGLNIRYADKVTFIQSGDVSDWTVSAHEITWRIDPKQPQLLGMNLNFKVSQGTILLGVTHRLAVELANGNIDLQGDTTGATIKLETGTLTIHGKFADSSFVGDGQIQFDGEYARAIRSRFRGKPPKLNNLKRLTKLLKAVANIVGDTAQNTNALDGQYFENCTFSGEYSDLALDSFTGNVFEYCMGKNLTMLGNWDGVSITSSNISGKSQGNIDLSNTRFASSKFSLVGDGQSKLLTSGMESKDSTLSFSNFTELLCKDGRFSGNIISFSGTGHIDLSNTDFTWSELAVVGDGHSKLYASGMESKDSSLSFSNFTEFLCKNGRFSGKKISFSGIDHIDLSGCTFENCELNFSGFQKISAEGTKFNNCQVNTDNKPKPASSAAVQVPKRAPRAQQAAAEEASTLAEIEEKAYSKTYHGNIDSWGSLLKLIASHRSDESSYPAIAKGIRRALDKLAKSASPSENAEAKQLKYRLSIEKSVGAIPLKLYAVITDSPLQENQIQDIAYEYAYAEKYADLEMLATSQNHNPKLIRAGVIKARAQLSAENNAAQLKRMSASLEGIPVLREIAEGMHNDVKKTKTAATSMNFGGSVIKGSTLTLRADTIDFKGAEIGGKSRVSGSATNIELADAQLGDSAGSRETTDWEMLADRTEISNLRIGNMMITDAKSFGDEITKLPWNTVVIVGTPSVMPDACEVFDKLKNAKNFAAALPPLPAGATPALQFTLE